MAIFLNETKPLTIYNGIYCYPINKKKREIGSVVYYFTPNLESTKKLLKYNSNKGSLNAMTYHSYFAEKDMTMLILPSNESGMVNINGEDIEYDSTLLESIDYNREKNTILTEEGISSSGKGFEYRSYFPGYIEDILLEDMMQFLEASKEPKKRIKDYSASFKKILYNQRIKNQKDILNLYDEIKQEFSYIKYTFVDTHLYKMRNLIVDWSYYTNILMRDKEKANLNYAANDEMILSYFTTIINDDRFKGYDNKTIIVPLNDWNKPDENLIDFKNNFSPASIILHALNYNYDYIMNMWQNYTIAFVSDNNKFFTLKFNEFEKSRDYNKLLGNLRKLITLADTSDVNVDEKTDSKDVILLKLANTIGAAGINISNISGGTDTQSKEELEDSGLLKDPHHSKDPEVKKAALVNKLEKTAEKSKNIDDALDSLNDESDDEKAWMTQLLIDLQGEKSVKLDKVRQARHDKTQEELLKKTVQGKTVKELLDQFKKNDDIPETSIPIDSIDEHWQHVKFPNFNSTYTEKDMQADIVAMFYHFTEISHPMNIININSENTSTSEDYINTWTVNYEDAETGKRSTMKLDLPIMIDNRFMRLRGNEKTLLGQMMLLPIVKTDDDTVQIVSNYNKIFVRRKSPAGLSKSTPIINRLSKALNKYEGKDIKVVPGDNKKVCTKYELPIAFIDLACQYSYIRFKDGSYIDFNLDNLQKIPIDRSSLEANDKKLPEDVLSNKYLAIYVNKEGKRQPVVNTPIDVFIENKMAEKSEEFFNFYSSISITKKLMYSEASVLAAKIPIIVVCSYSIGLQRTLDKANIKYEFSEKRPSSENYYIPFSDGYLIYYPKSDADNMLMNGIAQVDTKDFSIKEINSKDMWLSVLDDFGGRVKADGLDNFYDLMMDPITVEICKTLNIPYDYIGALLYANSLLIDNKFNRHSDITGNRLRVNEVIVGHLYKVLANQFGAYRNAIKKNNKQAMFTAKQSAVIDSLLTHDQTSSDLSTLTPLLEAKAASEITFKGLSGMNSERAFSIEKRAYDKSMLGVLGLVTGFAGTVGINRQMTIDAGVINKRGFIAPKDAKDLDTLSSQSVFEGLNPFGPNRDDPMRSAMSFVQTTAHTCLVRKSMPNLISTGMDEALIYITGDKFGYKFKGKRGKVVEMTDDYIVVQDLDTKEKDYIDTREKIQKNSDGGFYITTKLDANKGIKVGSILKQNDIVAYDKKAYSAAVGNGGLKNPNNLSYNIGTLSKVICTQSDLGFEDSCVVDEYVSEALEFELCAQKEVALAPTANIYYVVKPGQKIEEGEPLIIFNDNFEDEDANELLKSLVKDSDDILSDIGRKQVHAKFSGIVQDIKVYRTCEFSKLSDTLASFVKSYENKINKLKKVMESNNIEKKHTLEPTTKLPMVGKLKNVEGVLIEFYIKTYDRFGTGDKLVFNGGLKGVCSQVIPKEDSPYSEYEPEEKCNAFISLSGVFARMVPSMLLVGLTNKLLINLDRQTKRALGLPVRFMQEIMTDFKNK